MEISLRLPPLYVMDAILLYNMGIWTDPALVPNLHHSEGPNITEQIHNSTDLYDTFTNLYGGNPLMLLFPHIARYYYCCTVVL